MAVTKIQLTLTNYTTLSAIAGKAINTKASGNVDVYIQVPLQPLYFYKVNVPQASYKIGTATGRLADALNTKMLEMNSTFTVEGISITSKVWVDSYKVDAIGVTPAPTPSPDLPLPTVDKPNIFKQTWTWVKENPFKAALIGGFVILAVALIFSKRLQTWLGFRAKPVSKQLSGVKGRKPMGAIDDVSPEMWKKLANKFFRVQKYEKNGVVWQMLFNENSRHIASYNPEQRRITTDSPASFEKIRDILIRLHYKFNK